MPKCEEGFVHAYAENGETEIEDMYGNKETYRTWVCIHCGVQGISAKPKKYEDDTLSYIHEVKE